MHSASFHLNFSGTGRLFIINSLLFFLLLASSCQGTPQRSETASFVTVKGLVSLDAKSHRGATVSFYSPLDFYEGRELAQAVTDERGRFEVRLMPGDYLVTARASGLFGYFGRNPLRAYANQEGLSLPLSPAGASRFSPVPEGEEEVEGIVLFEGKPLEKATVQAYLDAKAGLKGPPYAASAPSGPDGRFKLALTPGRYYLAAKLRAGGQDTGPLAAGDLFGLLPDLPLTLEAGRAAKTAITAVKLPSAELMARYTTRFAELTGIIVDETGRPVAGFRPCLYQNARMIDEPLLVGEVTGPDGRFTLKVSRVGDFWLGAREVLGGPPKPGERIGFLKDSPNDGIPLKPGTLVENLTIVVRPVP